MLRGAGDSEHDTRKDIAYSTLYKCCSDLGGLPSALSTLQTETMMPDRSSIRSAVVRQMSTELEKENVVVQKRYKRSWVALGQSGYEEYMASELVEETCAFNLGQFEDHVDSRPNVEEFKTWETARRGVVSLTPPASKGVKEGHSPWLNQPRPEDISDYLRVFEVMFIVDDSDSMKGERWKAARNALTTIADHAYKFKADRVSLRFLNANHVRKLEGKKKLISLFDKVTPKGKTPLGKALKTVFDNHLKRIDSAVRKGKYEYEKIRPFNIVVVTDGVPSDKPAEVIANALHRLNKSGYHPNTMSIQIVQIGNHKNATKALGDLLSGNNGMIVDVVTHDGNLDSDKLERILLKGVHPNTRQQLLHSTKRP
ncbi:hypothetical protein JOM56_001908 [Amanita muscaria]